MLQNILYMCMFSNGKFQNSFPNLYYYFIMIMIIKLSLCLWAIVAMAWFDYSIILVCIPFDMCGIYKCQTQMLQNMDFCSISAYSIKYIHCLFQMRLKLHREIYCPIFFGLVTIIHEEERDKNNAHFQCKKIKQQNLKQTSIFTMCVAIWEKLIWYLCSE